MSCSYCLASISCWESMLHLMSFPPFCPQVPFSFWARSTSLESSLQTPPVASLLPSTWHALTLPWMNTQAHMNTHLAVDACTMWTYVICFKYCLLSYSFSVMHSLLYRMFCRLIFPILIFCVLFSFYFIAFLKDFECQLCIFSTLEQDNRFSCHVFLFFSTFSILSHVTLVCIKFIS